MPFISADKLTVPRSNTYGFPKRLLKWSRSSSRTNRKIATAGLVKVAGVIGEAVVVVDVGAVVVGVGTRVPAC
jgi:hypothetical protein